MLSLQKLKVRGFRGFVSERQFRFKSDVVILFGENRHGKSSTLNAIEWCFFGGDCVGEKTGIRERVGWEIPNRYMANPDVLVEVELLGPEGTYVVQRTLKKGKGRGKTTGELKLTLPDGTNVTGAEAGERLTRFRRSSFRDFLTTVYQHQEVIRNIVTQQPKERNDAIDRLLGLSEYKNFLTGLDDADCEKRQKDADGEFETTEVSLENVRHARDNDVREARKEASDGGVDKKGLNAKGALKLADDVLQSLADFASDAGIEPPNIKVPEHWKALPALQKSIKKEITRMRSVLPEQKEQNSLHRRQKTASDLKSDYEDALEARKNAQAEVDKLDKVHGSQKKLLAKITSITEQIKRKEQERKDANARADLVKRAIDYLDEAEVEEFADRCPVCGKTVPDLLKHLRNEWEKKLERHVATIQKKIDTLKKNVAELKVVREDYADLHQKLEKAHQDLAESRDEIDEYLEMELTEKDDPLAPLKKELRTIANRLKKLQAALEEKQKVLNHAEDDLAKVELVVRLLQAQDKKRTIDQIKESQEFEDLENVRDQMAQLVEDVACIKRATSAALIDEAEQKVAVASKTIDQYFRDITHNPAVKQIRLDVHTRKATGQTDYKLRDQDGNDLMPVLNQGDANALALSIFLGLSASAGEAGNFGFVMLDDPSQSLGSGHKARLASILNAVNKHRQIILSTMDAELFKLLDNTLTKAKTTYKFTDWSVEAGPTVQAE